MIVMESRAGLDAPATRNASRLAGLLPREHGSWALALEPLALALVAAPSARGAALALAAVAVFLMRRPMQLLRQGARQGQAIRALAALGCVATLAVIWGCAGAFSRVAAPLLVAGVGGGIFCSLDARRAGRTVAAELSGATCFAAIAAAVACVHPSPQAWGVGAAVGGFALARSITAILPIRVWLRRRRGETTSPVAPLLAAGLAVAAAAAHAAVSGVWVPLAWCLVFAARTLWLVGPRAPAWTARQLGVVEIFLGAAALVSTGIALP